MLSYLGKREMGVSDPVVFHRLETSRRVLNLKLSDIDVEKMFTGSINSLDLDLIEKRYLLAGGADGFIVIYDTSLKPGVDKHTFPSVGSITLNNRARHKFSVETVNWYPLDTGMFTSSGTDNLLKVWDTNRLKPADEYQFSGVVYNHHMSPIATRHCLIAVASKSASVKLVDLKSGSSTHSLKGHSTSVLTVKWSPYNEFILATGGADCNVHLWDIRNAKGSLLTFDQYNGKPSKKKTTLTGVTSHSSCVNGVQFSSDGLHLISCSNDNTVHLWNTSTGQNTNVNYGRVVNRLKKSMQFAVSDDCSPDVIFMPNEVNRSVDVFNMVSGKKLFSLLGHYSYVNSCLYNPDCQELYTAGNDRNILVWTPNLTSANYEHTTERKRKRTVVYVNKETRPVCEKVVQDQTGPVVKAVPNPVTADNWSSDEET